MMTLYAIWGGTLSPLSVDGQAVTITQADLIGTWANMCTALNAGINDIAGEAEIEFDEETGRFNISSVPAVAWNFDAGFASFCGFASAAYNTNNSQVIAEADAPYILTGQRLSFDMPIALWLRELRHLDPVVWRGPLRAWDVRWVVPYAQDIPFDPRRSPFVAISSSGSGPWDFDNRSGWVAMRPMGDAWQRRPVGRRTRALGEYTFRCSDMGVTG